ncbi:MAG: transposase [Actinobacteria bacterium]|nr:transposase [Actinomycetota bacterium]
MAKWLSGLGGDVVVGIEGTGTYGAGLCEFLLASGIQVVEVERPRREDRRRGKSDEIDALLAAKKVLAGDGLSTPRAGGTRQVLSALLVAHRSCIVERTRVLNQLQALHTSAPVALRERIGRGNGRKLCARLPRMRARQGSPEAERLISPSCATWAPAPASSRSKPTPTSGNSAA